VVTYNGKSFDLPVLETRYVIHRMETPFAGLPHVDMLHPARRLWRAADDGDGGDEALARRTQGGGGCRLTSLEQTLCGHHREGDVPGFEIPARYFHYVRTGEARQLEAVLEHNRLDLLSLALLTARAARLLEDGPQSSRLAREALGLGQLYERAGLLADARVSFDRAVSLPSADVATRAEALRSLAITCRRSRDYESAADAWQTALDLRGCPAPIVREATEALAVHHEHRRRDPQSARTFALRSLRLPVTQSRREAIEHRLARLNRKLDEGPEAAPLF
jgi:tetratricopeptide (TPR) repeat protein